MISMNDIHITADTYTNSDPADGLYESNIECSECGADIGAWQYDTQDSTVEMFIAYWMCDLDNNYNVCEGCYQTESVQKLKIV